MQLKLRTTEARREVLDGVPSARHVYEVLKELGGGSTLNEPPSPGALCTHNKVRLFAECYPALPGLLPPQSSNLIAPVTLASSLFLGCITACSNPRAFALAVPPAWTALPW